MKICVIGAGVSGLSVAKLLKDKFDVEILEADEQIGGIAKTKTVDGIAYHMIGGTALTPNIKKYEILYLVYMKRIGGMQKVGMQKYFWMATLFHILSSFQ